MRFKLLFFAAFDLVLLQFRDNSSDEGFSFFETEITWFIAKLLPAYIRNYQGMLQHSFEFKNTEFFQESNAATDSILVKVLANF